ncbi:TPA: hypothetical protein F6U11_06970 [Citrobacter freundii]|nr:hypothetical protein [Citrobacter freundii]
MPVAIQQSPEKGCTNLVHYSFLLRKSAKDQVVGGEKSPSCDGLKVPRQLKNSRRLPRRCCVSYLRSPHSHSYLCSWGFAQLPLCRNVKFVGLLKYG